jgi:hypothetical protein
VLGIFVRSDGGWCAPFYLVFAACCFHDPDARHSDRSY